MTAMETFEKWCDEIEYFCVDYSKRDSMRRGWKAALEWIRDNREMKAWDDVDDMIKKELGNGNK